MLCDSACANARFYRSPEEAVSPFSLDDLALYPGQYCQRYWRLQEERVGSLSGLPEAACCSHGIEPLALLLLDTRLNGDGDGAVGTLNGNGILL